MTTKNHTVKFNTDQLVALKVLAEWYLENFKKRPVTRDLEGKRESLVKAKGIIDYSLNNPDFKF